MAKNYKEVNEEKASFIIYKSWEDAFSMLSNEEQAQMMRNLFLWHRNEEPVLNTPSLKLVWSLIEFNLIQNAENYDKRSETSARNGKLGGAPKGNTNAKKQPIQPNSTYNNPNDNVNVDDNGNEYEKEYDNGNGKVDDSGNGYSAADIVDIDAEFASINSKYKN